MVRAMESPGQRLTRPAERARPDPVAARPDDELGHGLVMKRRLGKGATALALLVERDGREHVLKVALSAERFAAAVTLHQMAAGSLPRWGDGRSEPAVLDCEATIDADAFEPAIREGMTEFFRKALRRDYRVRFDNAEEMLRAWRQLFLAAARPETDTRYRGPSATPRLTSGVFLAAARPETDTDDAGTPPRFIGIAEACPDTLLGVLGLSARGMNATERMGVRTVGDLLRFPLIQVNRLRGVGSRTRRELSDLARRLAERFPEAARAPKIATTGDSAEIPDEAARASVDELRRQLLPAGRTAQSRRDTDLLAALLGLGDDGPAAAWPSQSDVARGARRLPRGRQPRRRTGAAALAQDRRADPAPARRCRDARSARQRDDAAGARRRPPCAPRLGAGRAAPFALRRGVRAAVEMERQRTAPRWLVRRIAGPAGMLLARDEVDDRGEPRIDGQNAGRLR